MFRKQALLFTAPLFLAAMAGAASCTESTVSRPLYMGHDAFVIEANKLVRTFPVYQKTDTNQHPTGGKRKVIYGLYPGEAMWQLKVEKSKTLMNQPGT